MSQRLAPMIIVLMAASSVFAQRGAAFQRDKNDFYPLGGIEAQGLVERDGDNVGIVIKELFTDGLAEKGDLILGDVIFKVQGKKLKGKTDDDVINNFCSAVEKIETKKPSGKFGYVKVEIKRGQLKKKLSIPVRFYGPFSKNSATKCKKTAKILSDAYAFLAKRQQDTGAPQHVSNQNHAVATASLSGLAWIGSGKKKYAKNITKAVDFVMENAGKERDFGRRQGGANWNQTNWSLSYAAIFLSEYYAQKQKPSVKKRLQEIVNKLQENQEASGGWAHGPGGPNALNYLELEIMSNLALGGMGMAERCGLKLDNGKVVKGYQWVKKCTSGGGVAYSPKPGQAGNGDPGRTAGALWALKQIGKGKDLQAQMAKFYSRGLDQLYEGHACPTMHILNGALASAVLGKKSYAKFFQTWRPFIMASRTKDGAFGCRPNHESRQMRQHADRAWGPSFVTAHYVLALQLGQGKFKRLDTSSAAQ